MANPFIKKWHYSGKVVNNSKLHFGAFLCDELHGVMSFGSPIDKSKVLHLVETENKGINQKWNEMLELNRMAFDPFLPRNSESRCIGVAFRIIKAKYPQIKWILSFADGTQCGDGAIYRASGFKLSLIKKNSDLFECEDGTQIHSMTIKTSKKLRNKYGTWKNALLQTHGQFAKIEGFQLRYIKILDESSKLTVPEIPFSKIAEIGAGMYKGIKREPISTDSSFPVEKGGANPTLTLQKSL